MEILKKERHNYKFGRLNNFGRIVGNIGEKETHITSHILLTILLTYTILYTYTIHLILQTDFSQNGKKRNLIIIICNGNFE